MILYSFNILFLFCSFNNNKSLQSKHYREKNVHVITQITNKISLIVFN